MVLITTSCTVSWTSIHNSSSTLLDLIPWIYLWLPLYNCKEFDLIHTWMVWWFSPTFFNIRLNISIRNSWSESQSVPVTVFADCIELFHLCCKEYKQSYFGVDHLVMSMCRVVSCVVGRGYLLWPVDSHGKILLAFALIHFVPQGQICLLHLVSLDFLLLHSSPL